MRHDDALWLLAQHPRIFIPEVKETAFFAFAYDYGWDWYAKFFETAREEQLRGEGSTYYSSTEFAEVSSARIVQAYPDARFIFIARDPIKRLESSFREYHHSGGALGVETSYDIGEAVRLIHAMIDDTLYWRRLRTYRQQVPDSRILVMFLEDLQRQPAVELERCFQFLGVDPSVRIGNLDRRLNTREEKCYDSRLMRRIRRHAWLRERWDRLSESRKAQLTKWLGLRKRFTKPIRWSAEAPRWVLDRIGDDARQFLKFGGKPADFWDLKG